MSEREQPPFPTMTVRRASKLLGVDPEWLRGLVVNSHPSLRGWKTVGRTGHIVWLVSRDDVMALSGKVQVTS